MWIEIKFVCLFDSTTYIQVVNSSIWSSTGISLGPLVLLAYVIEVFFFSSNRKTNIFADDTTLSFKGERLENLINTINPELAKNFRWSFSNKLSISAEKVISYICQ